MAELVDLKNEHARKLLRQCLGQCEAMNLATLVQRLDMDRETISREIDRLVHEGEVEALRPIATDPRLHSAEQCDRREHFRLIRDTDNDYLWEQEVVVPTPEERMTNSNPAGERRTIRKEFARSYGKRTKLVPTFSFS